ncbi:hypothetical protein LCGC14_1346260 [marine sediment metagenome]|uniref:Uncharacterized protein n=1 Tax=marine sediment metagenome TaxID=412755 RepID=A0A0F9MT47_9ZZZZ
MQVTDKDWQTLQLTLQGMELAQTAQAKATKEWADHTRAQNNRISTLEHDAIKQAAVIGILKWLIPVALAGSIGVAATTIGILELVLG